MLNLSTNESLSIFSFASSSFFPLPLCKPSFPLLHFKKEERNICCIYKYIKTLIFFTHAFIGKYLNFLPFKLTVGLLGNLKVIMRLYLPFELHDHPSHQFYQRMFPFPVPPQRSVHPQPLRSSLTRLSCNLM